ncbi:hypothetical protein KEJ34_02565 [Candidatus Bathyarchaeota archaeon]|nr:hypothetical protein [Candidatus Bathyarchaeota archaeon]
MLYLGSTKHYVCRRCGLSLTLQEIVEVREKIREKTGRGDEEQKRVRKEYLQWWLSRKK